jgi:hypothetical protein
MHRKNLILALVAIVLLFLNLMLMRGEGGEERLSYDDAMFAVSDTASIRSIKIDDILLERKAGLWQLEEAPADAAILNYLLSILHRVRVKKPVGPMSPQGASRIWINGEEAFAVSSNERQTRTFFIKEGTGYEVEIPGFSDYLGGVFELDRDQYRDRLLIDGNWRSIQALRLQYKADSLQDLEIIFTNGFFDVVGQDAIDSSAVVNYLEQYRYFQANEFVRSGRVAYLDSLVKTEPMATLAVVDIKQPEGTKLNIFPRNPGDAYYLLTNEKGEMYVVEEKRMQGILAEPQDFSAVK